MMARLLLTFVGLALCILAHAIPAKRTPFTVEQSDGTSLTLILIGDESLHFLSTEDGIPVKEVDGVYYYAVMSDTLAATTVLAHDDSLRTDTEKEFIQSFKEQTLSRLSEVWSARVNKRNAARIKKRFGSTTVCESKTRKALGQSKTFTGEKKGIVILVNYSNLTMKSTSTTSAFDNMFNLEGYTNSNGAIGSVHDYFYDQSYGKLSLTFDVVGPVTVSRQYSYYGKNDSNGEDSHPAKLVTEACKLADALGVDFSKYDWDGDGEVDQIYIIYAGYGENQGASSSTIWPHESSLSGLEEYGDGDGPIKLDGVTIDTYAMSCELRGTSGSNMEGIGTACHEFSHCMGFPDLYDTSYEGGFGMNGWDLLDSGSYGGPSGNSNVPCGYTAYERWFAGWLDFKELDSPCDITDMPCLGDEPVAYIIYNDANHNEYFTLENRQNKRWYSYVSSYTGIHGMLITHIDYDDDAWKNNHVNYDAKHQRMSIIPADNNYGTLVNRTRIYYTTSKTGLYGDLYPGYLGITALTNTSHKNYGGLLFNKNTDGTYYMNKPITDIKEADGLISFKFMGGAANAIDDVRDDDGKVTYYNMNGMKLDSEPTAHGVYIMTKGSETKKIYK